MALVQLQSASLPEVLYFHVAIATMAGTIITASCVNGTGTESG